MTLNEALDKLVSETKDLETEFTTKPVGNFIVIKVISKSRVACQAKFEAIVKQGGFKIEKKFIPSMSSSSDTISPKGQPSTRIVFKPKVVKGQGGLSFEKELKVDLENYYAGAVDGFLHPGVISEFSKIDELQRLSLQGKVEVTHDGAQNSRRALIWGGGKFSFTNSDGRTLTDLTLVPGRGKKIYLSLKMSESYYQVNGSIHKFFSDPSTRTKAYEYFGFDGTQMGAFGKEFFDMKTKKQSPSRVKANMEQFIADTMGHDYYLIHKRNDRDSIVKKVGKRSKVSILTPITYNYPSQTRKGGNIKFDMMIDRYKYKCELQFRGTSAHDRGPKYVRVLFKRL